MAFDRETAEPRVERLPGERAEQWVAYHRGFAAPSTYVYDFVWDVTAPAAGPFCTDVDGNRLVDFTSHVASAPLGYNNPALLERLREFDLVDPLKIAGQDVYASAGWPPEDPAFPGPAQLTERLVEATAHYDMDTVFLSNSGAEAVENAIKVCYDHRRGAYGITFDGAFHGRTLGALSLNRSKAVHRRAFPEIAGVADVPFCRDRTCAPEVCSCGFFTDAATGSRLRDKLDPDRGVLDPSEVSYVVIEPIQGEGGFHVPSEAFMDEVAAVCREHDVPLIADEIQAGLGRTGEVWASDHWAIEPDVITAAKGLRVGATISREAVFPDEPGRLSSTWGGGDLLSSLVGSLTLDIVTDDDLMANATVRGEQFTARMREADPGFVSDVRGMGLMLGVEFDTRARRDAVMDACLERGLLTLGAGYKTIRLLPPMDVTDREMALGTDLLLDAIDDPSVARAG